jgi:acyl-CoA-binding protein
VTDRAREEQIGISQTHKLQLYGLYKRITEGPASQSSEVMPNMFNVVARKKYTAWAENDVRSEEECMLQYVEIIAGLDCNFGKDTSALLSEFKK